MLYTHTRAHTHARTHTYNEHDDLQDPTTDRMFTAQATQTQKAVHVIQHASVKNKKMSCCLDAITRSTTRHPSQQPQSSHLPHSSPSNDTSYTDIHINIHHAPRARHLHHLRADTTPHANSRHTKSLLIRSFHSQSLSMFVRWVGRLRSSKLNATIDE